MAAATQTAREQRTETRAIERLIPAWDVRSYHQTVVQAPASTVFAVAEHFDLQAIPLVKAIFWLRGRILGSTPTSPRRPVGLVAETKSLGWGELFRQPGRELVMGAVTKPWLADVQFTAVPAGAFLGYGEHDSVKIVWTIEVVPIEAGLSLLRTETRVRATDLVARAKFLRYWRFAHYGIELIRRLCLPAIRRAAELQYRLRTAGEPVD